MPIVAGEQRIANGITKHDSGEIVMGSVVTAGSAAGTALGSNKIGGPVAGALVGIGTLYDAGRAGLEAHRKGKNAGEVAAATGDAGIRIASNAALDWVTFGTMGDLAGQVYDNQKEGLGKIGGLGREVHDMASGKQKFNMRRLATHAFAIPRDYFLALGRGVQSTAFVQAPVKSHDIYVAINDTHHELNHVADANKAVDLPSKASHDAAHAVANHITTNLGSHFVTAEINMISDPHYAEELKQIGVKTGEKGRISLTTLNDALAGPNAAVVSAKLTEFIVAEKQKAQKAVDGHHTFFGSVSTFFKEAVTGDASAAQDQANKDLYTNALREMRDYEIAYQAKIDAEHEQRLEHCGEHPKTKEAQNILKKSGVNGTGKDHHIIQPQPPMHQVSIGTDKNHL